VKQTVCVLPRESLIVQYESVPAEQTAVEPAVRVMVTVSLLLALRISRRSQRFDVRTNFLVIPSGKSISRIDGDIRRSLRFDPSLVYAGHGEVQDVSGETPSKRWSPPWGDS
jgi:hypothetical protein